MPSFTIIIGHLQNNKSLEEFNPKFSELGLSKKISASSGMDYLLPEGVFNFSADISRQELLEKIKNSFADEYSKIYVLITESRGRTWSNLKRVDDVF